MDCVFCKIVSGDIPSHKVWESETHIAFLSIFPNIEGFTVVAPKKHLSSYVFELADEEYVSLMQAARDVGLLLDKALDVQRSALMAEGTGVNHAHVKLFPLIGLKPHEEWKNLEAHSQKTFDKYEGYISSLEGPRADDSTLAKLAEKIRMVNENE